MQRRWYLISSLNQIYKISPIQGQLHSMINSVPLPNSEFVGFDEEQIAVSLGFVAHAVFMVSKYLDVRLLVHVCLFMFVLFMFVYSCLFYSCFFC